MKLMRLSEDAALLPLYQKYVESNPACMLYYSLNYRDFIKEIVGCDEEYLVVVDGDDIKGILPLMYLERNNRRVYNSLPYYGSHGGIIADTVDAEELLINKYNSIAMLDETVSSTLVGNPLSNSLPAKVLCNYSDYRIGQITDISAQGGSATDNIMDRLESRARGSIRKAEREGIVVEKDGSQLDHLANMHDDNLKSIGGLSKSESFFRLVPKYFSENDTFNLYIAKKADDVVAALLVFYFNGTVEYYVPAVKKESRSLQPMALILIQAMSEASERGHKLWNWGGTWCSQSNVYRFKRQWGAVDYNYSYQTYLNDDSLLSFSSQKILAAYPNYYVIPFDTLNANSAGRAKDG